MGFDWEGRGGGVEFGGSAREIWMEWRGLGVELVDLVGMGIPLLDVDDLV